MSLFLLGCVIGALAGSSIGFCIFSILRMGVEARTMGYPRVDSDGPMLVASLGGEEPLGA